MPEWHSHIPSSRLARTKTTFSKANWDNNNRNEFVFNDGWKHNSDDSTSSKNYEREKKEIIEMQPYVPNMSFWGMANLRADSKLKSISSCNQINIKYESNECELSGKMIRARVEESTRSRLVPASDISMLNYLWIVIFILLQFGTFVLHFGPWLGMILKLIGGKKIHINCHVQKEENRTRTAEKLHKSLLGPEMLKKLHLTQMPTFHPREEIDFFEQFLWILFFIEQFLSNKITHHVCRNTFLFRYMNIDQCNFNLFFTFFTSCLTLNFFFS